MMRRLFDRLMARWYVPRSAYDGAQNFFINETRRLTDALVAERQMHHRREIDAISRVLHPIVITTDYQRGIPCS